MFISKKTVTIHQPGGGSISLIKGQEVKPGVVKKMELNSPGSTDRYVLEISDNYIQRQLRWCKVIEKDSQMNLLWTHLNDIVLQWLPAGKKVGQWCVGKQNKIHNSVVNKFSDIVKEIPNEYKSSTHNWDGPQHCIIMDDDSIDKIRDYINLQCALLF